MAIERDQTTDFQKLALIEVVASIATGLAVGKKTYNSLGRFRLLGAVTAGVTTTVVSVCTSLIISDALIPISHEELINA